MNCSKISLLLFSAFFAGTTFLGHSQAQAAGYYVPTAGAVNMARGGANLAHPGGVLETMWMNPAALVDLKGLQFQLAANLAYQKSSFARADVPDNNALSNFPQVDNAGGPFMTLSQFGVDVGEEDSGTSIGPSAVGLSYNIKDKLTLALAVQGPLGVNESYPVDGPQRYSVIRSSPVQINFQLGLGFNIHPKIAVGLIMQGIYMQFNQTMIMGADVLSSEDLSFDNAIAVKGSDPFTGSFAMGLRLGAFGPLTISASFQKGIQARADGHLDIKFGDAVDSLAAATGGMQLSGIDGDDAIGISFYIPDIYRIGLHLGYPKWDLEFVAEIEDWSSFDAVYVDTRDIQLYNKTLEDLHLINGIKTFGTIVLPRNWETSVMLSLGGGYYPLGNLLAVRAGIFWEKGAIPKEYLDTSRMDMPKIGVGTGLGINIKNIFNIDLAFAYIHSFTQEVTSSNARIIPAIDTVLSNGTVIMQQQIAAGTYKADTFTASLSLRFVIPI